MTRYELIMLFPTETLPQGTLQPVIGWILEEQPREEPNTPRER